MPEWVASDLFGEREEKLRKRARSKKTKLYLRAEQNQSYRETEPDLKQINSGVKQFLRNYYSQIKASASSAADASCRFCLGNRQKLNEVLSIAKRGAEG